MIKKNKNGRNQSSRSVDNLENKIVKKNEIASLEITKNTFFEENVVPMDRHGENGFDNLITPRKLLPILDDIEDGEDTEEEEEGFHCEKAGVSSGRWSTLSWSSLYERGSESSLSWADDELERDATDKVRSIFKKIEAELYMEEENSKLDPFPMSRLPRDVKDECAIWRDRFPHLRIIGKSIAAPSSQIAEPIFVPKPKQKTKKVERKMCDVNGRDKSVKSVTSSASSVASTISVLTLNDDNDDDDDEINDVGNVDEEEEEVFASHGVYRESDRGHGFSSLGHGIDVDWVLNDKFEADPKKYLEDKLVDALFKKIWCSVSPALQQVVDRFALHVIEQNSDFEHLDHQANNFWSFESISAPYMSGYRMSALPFQFDSIDENSVLTGLRDHLAFDDDDDDDLDDVICSGEGQRYFPPRVILSSPTSDLNPVSLPNLRPVPASAPIVRESGVRPTSSQTRNHSPLNRWKRSNSFRGNNNNNNSQSKNRAITALGTFNQQQQQQPQQLGRGPLRNSATYEDNKTTSHPSVIRRMRSKSGSPPSRPPTVGSVRSQPISLPPIFGTASSPNRPTSTASSFFGPLGSPFHSSSASTSGYSSLTAPISRLGSSTLNTPRSLRLDSGKTTPTISSRPLTSDISISGIRLKKIDANSTTTLTGNDGKTTKGRISSGHSAAHWDAKTTLTPSHAKPRFRY